ncbi:MAG: hypothetical protein V3U52_01240 [Thermoplasmata archaeon]
MTTPHAISGVFESEEYFRKKIERVLHDAWKNDIPDAIIVKVLWELIEDIADSADMVQAALAELRGDSEDEDEGIDYVA